MFGLSANLTKILAILAIVSSLLGAVYGAYSYVSGLEERLAISEANNVKLESALETQGKVITAFKEDMELMKEVDKQFALDLQSNAENVNRLRRDLRSATNKINNIDVNTANPETIKDAETEINSRYNDLINCFGKGAKDACKIPLVTP